MVGEEAEYDGLYMADDENQLAMLLHQVVHELQESYTTRGVTIVIYKNKYTDPSGVYSINKFSYSMLLIKMAERCRKATIIRLLNGFKWWL